MNMAEAYATLYFIVDGSLITAMVATAAYFIVGWVFSWLNAKWEYEAKIAIRRDRRENRAREERLDCLDWWS